MRSTYIAGCNGGIDVAFVVVTAAVMSLLAISVGLYIHNVYGHKKWQLVYR